MKLTRGERRNISNLRLHGKPLTLDQMVSRLAARRMIDKGTLVRAGTSPGGLALWKLPEEKTP